MSRALPGVQSSSPVNLINKTRVVRRSRCPATPGVLVGVMLATGCFSQPPAAGSGTTVAETTASIGTSGSMVESGPAATTDGGASSASSGGGATETGVDSTTGSTSEATTDWRRQARIRLASSASSSCSRVGNPSHSKLLGGRAEVTYRGGSSTSGHPGSTRGSTRLHPTVHPQAEATGSRVSPSCRRRANLVFVCGRASDQATVLWSPPTASSSTR